MNDYGALAYLEFRQLVNSAKKIVREPGRTILWVLAAGYFVFIGFTRSYGGRYHGAHSGVSEPFASAIFFAALGFAGIGVFSAAGGRVAAFSSIADARFLIDSRLSERNVILWLQLRSSWRLVGRLLFLIVFYAIIFKGAGTVAGMGLAMVGLSAISTAVGVPIVKLQRRFGAFAGYAAAAAVALVAVLPLLVLGGAMLVPSLQGTSDAIVRSGFGRVTDAMLAGNWRPLAIEYLIFIVLLLAAYVGAKDLYPELYASSERYNELRARMKQRGFTFGQNPKYATSEASTPMHAGESRALPGAWAIFWKEWIGFRRSPGSQRLFWLGLAGAAIVGAAIGIVASKSDDTLGVSLGIGASLGNLLVIFLALGSAVALAGDLRKPIWWLSADPIRARLYAWVAAASWRTTAVLASAFVAWGIASRAPVVIVFGVPIAAIVIVLLRSIGLALYAIFPSSFDQRGPVAMLRMLLTYLSLAPPAAAWIAVGYFSRSTVNGGLCALAVAVLEMLLLVEFAAFRIARVGATFAQGEA
ncbi:MAG: putative ABC exporter domain-containing protein [Candidatus Eremiobacteraeota bacterium]|nr:putative ABC exporter domain-containing protein [Candidatus Eremiobacteraeota bacterium]